MRSFLTILCFTAILAAIVWLGRFDQSEFHGKAYAVDGDSLNIDGERLRLFGLDAPELEQNCFKGRASWPCGQRSKRHLANLIKGQVLVCESRGRGRYDRPLVICSTDELNINVTMVESGWAVDYGGYYSEEIRARKSKNGVWQGTFETPEQWRKNKRLDASADGLNYPDLKHSAFELIRTVSAKIKDLDWN